MIARLIWLAVILLVLFAVSGCATCPPTGTVCPGHAECVCQHGPF